jgi:hypothetical protein
VFYSRQVAAEARHRRRGIRLIQGGLALFAGWMLAAFLASQPGVGGILSALPERGIAALFTGFLVAAAALVLAGYLLVEAGTCTSSGRPAHPLWLALRGR